MLRDGEFRLGLEPRMGVEPMTYGFFGVYKAVALPLSYRGAQVASRKGLKINHYQKLLAGPRPLRPSCGPHERVDSWQGLSRQ